ncbi:GNAT family N-acetyltransferase [Geomicrobium sediminis]|uniref:GNAT superfamily N-acetyltransferase n=1 Tax=Geomicrobium sediminis TaxID=1347788 RepID=A0ABS2P9N8_9BACL|nr:GNAT family N-acetyltransferase [Geomicrobium sediminis]MBM7631558.1 GNAT superfamily N-acetyltransferase [Geomicrobium sediminis]
MKIYALTEQHDQQIVQKATELLMGQMESIGGEHAYDNILTTLHEVKDPDSNAELFIAEDQGIMVGAAFLNTMYSIRKGGRYVWLNDLYVREDQRNKGIAKKMLLAIIHWAEQHDYKGIELETGINNIATKRLYNSLGFYDVVSKRYGFQF